MTVPENYIAEHFTKRLTIRPLTEAHIEPWTKYLSDPRATEFYPERGVNPAESADAWINSQLNRYTNGRFGVMALHLEDGTFIGQCGLVTQELNGEQLLEIGYHLFPEYWGKGYASEAAVYFKSYAFEHGISDSVVSIIHVSNVNSQAVARRNGMEPWKEAEWNGKPSVIYRVLSPET